MADPSGVDLCSGTTNANTLPAYTSSWEEREITFSVPYQLTSGLEYAIVVRAVDAIDNDSVYWIKSNTGYASGLIKNSANSGSSWSDDSANDLWFETYAGETVKDSYTPSDTSSWSNDIFNVNWTAQTFAASSTYTISGVKLKLAKWPTASPGDLTVSIQATGGAPTKASTPAPANAASGVALNLTAITWADGGNTLTYKVYYGTESGNLSLLVSGLPVGTETYTVTDIADGAPYEYLVTRYWRIDSVNDVGTTTGDEWSFTTLNIDPPARTYWYSTGGYYYRLLPQEGGGYGDPPPTGVEDTDYEVLAGYLPNFINTNKRLVAATRNSIYYEDV